MTAEQAHGQAAKNFCSGMNCAQAVVSVFAEEFGFDAEMIRTLAQPFGGGMCRMREMCGTVSGMMLALGMHNAVNCRASAQEQPAGTSEKARKDATYKIGQQLADEFRKINGSIICRELLGLVPVGTSEKLLEAGKPAVHKADEPVSEERTPEYYKKRPCAELCGVAAEIFQRFLENQR